MNEEGGGERGGMREERGREGNLKTKNGSKICSLSTLSLIGTNANNCVCSRVNCNCRQPFFGCFGLVGPHSTV